MRKATVALLVFMCGIWLPHYSACMDLLNSNIYGDGLYLDQDTHLAASVTVDTGGVYIMSSLMLENDANILGDIYVCDECNFSIRNTGVITGKIRHGNDVHITQVINRADDMTRLDVDGNFVILADGVRDILWADLASFSVNAGTLILHDSSVVITDNVCNEFVVFLDGEITVKIPIGFSILDNNLLMRNVKGTGRVVLDGAFPGDLYAYMSYIENDNLYINVVRETDYVKILGQGRGSMLNMLREIRPDDALLRRLDGAKSLSELHDIMAHSVAFNPGILGRPIRVLNKFATDSLVGNLDMASGRPFYIVADDFDVYGAMADMSFVVAKGLSVGVLSYGAIAESKDEINAFSAGVYGGGIFANYLNDMWMLRGRLGATYADFVVPYIFDGEHIRNRADLVSGYAVTDFGFIIGAFMPYVGVEYYRERILGITDTEFSARLGIESKFMWDSEIGEYEYKMMAGINSVGVANIGAAIGVLSPDDMVGGDLAINVMHDEYGFATMLSISVKFLF